jgi:methylmalonyl-CoA mutase
MPDKEHRFLDLSAFNKQSQDDWIKKAIQDLRGKDFSSIEWSVQPGLALPPMAFFNALRREKIQSLEQESYSDDRQYGPRKWLTYEFILVENEKEANAEALASLNSGADGIHFQINRRTRLSLLLQDILPAYAGLVFSGDYDQDVLRSALEKYWGNHAMAADQAIGFVDWDPLRDQLLGRRSSTDAMIAPFFSGRPTSGGYKALTVDTGLYADAGASLVHQIALGLHHTVAYLDAFTDDRFPVLNVLESMSFKVAMGSSFFPEIAKVKALKLLLQRIAGAYGVEHWKPYVYAHTSCWSKSFYDPYVNMLRNTTEAFSAILGGADALSVLPHNAGLVKPNPFDRRMSRNVSLILRDESYLDKIADPVAGAYYLEELILQLSEAAWEAFLALEEKGSWMENSASGYLLQLVNTDRSRTMEAIATRKKVVIGTNMYPNSADKVMNAHEGFRAEAEDGWRGRHASAEVEGFRMRLEKEGHKRHALMIPLSKGFMTSARMNFTLSYLGVSGIHLSEWDPEMDGEWPLADCLVLCGSDEDYTQQLVDLLPKLKSKSPAKLFLAGDPGEQAAMFTRLGLDGWFSARSTVTEDLQHLISLID